MAKVTNDIVIIGKIGAPYGVKGWSKLYSYTQPVENILDYQPWLIRQKDDWRPIDVVPGKPHSKIVIAQLPGSHNREDAKLYTHTEIGVYRDQLPALQANEFYWNDLIGLTVIDINQKNLGKVIQLSETGANDVLIIKGEKEFAVPMIMDKVIKEVNVDQGFIQVDWEPIY